MNARNNSVATKLAIQVAALLVCLPGLSQADSATPALRSVQVSTVGLDLNTPVGAQALYGRLSTAAKSVCGREFEGDPIYGGKFELCYRVTLRSVVHTVNRPLVTKRYNEQHGAADALASEDASLVRMAAK
ncbi:MAG TPA: UrcA family protein [Steroidobacteraceae bacterium]|jgi:UrcA family protein|nr:UrcA family protein [Steroidobacteraceae bacterium]